jgi:glycosyltransferase involved in cell wall biosynthesis
MKIGIMLRHIDQHGGGVMVYTQSLLPRLFSVGKDHEFVLLYPNQKHIGVHAHHDNVKEVALSMPTKLLWDQVAVCQAEKKEGLDLIFNPKYSVPLKARCPTVFVVHGLDWYVMPWGSRWFDRLSHRYLIPRYVRKAAGIIAVSNSAREHVMRYLAVDEERVSTVYLGLDGVFWQPVSEERRYAIKRKYGLPDRYLLYVGQIYPPKNFGRLLRAYAKVGPRSGIHLVVAGTHSWGCEQDLRLVGQLDLQSWVVTPGWIDRETLPAFYSMAQALLLPSLYEGCGAPAIEAMASGCPVVTSNRYGTTEIVQNAGVLVDPEDVDNIADGMRQVTTDRELRAKLIAAGYARARDFDWEKCAQETLDFLERIHREATV